VVAGLLLLPRWSGFASAACAAIQIGLYVATTRRLSRSPGTDAFALPAAVWLLVFVMARSVLLAVRRGGVYWRGTFYSLRQLKGK